MRRRGLWLIVVLLVAALGGAANAQTGFTINRFEPSPAGEGTFTVDHPWYESTRRLSAGLTLNYGHDPLVVRPLDGGGAVTSVIGHQLVGHVDLAVAVSDRVTLSGTLPVVLLERGMEVGGVGPSGEVRPGDPRFGLMMRLWGDPARDRLSIHAGLSLWVPLGLGGHAGDTSVRLLPRVVVAGRAGTLRYSGVVGVYVRPEGVLGAGTVREATAGSEFDLGGSLYYMPRERLALGPELRFATRLLGGEAFTLGGTSMEILGGAHYRLPGDVLVGAAAGLGLLRMPGTPDLRLLLRVAWAPSPKAAKPPPPPDADGDGVDDRNDACPDVAAAGPAADPARPGCPRVPQVPQVVERYAVLREEDGHVGAVEVEGGGARRTLDRGGQVIDHGADGRLREAPAGTDAEVVFKDALAALPARPVAPAPPPDKEWSIVMAEDDGHVGGVEVGGGVVLDKANAAAAVDPSGSPRPVTLDEAERQRLFGEALAAQPRQPRRFVVWFQNGTRMEPGAKKILDEVMDEIRKRETYQVEVLGYTDRSASDTYNQRLSEQRARAVVDLLRRRGVPAPALEWTGRGEATPLVPTDDDIAEPRNRRAEVIVR